MGLTWNSLRRKLPVVEFNRDFYFLTKDLLNVLGFFNYGKEVIINLWDEFGNT